MKRLRVAIVGAGWSGLACAVEADRLGHRLTLFEAARTAGGRARRLPPGQDPLEARLDNGQHILIGAYTETLGLMRQLGVDCDRALLRLPLSLRFADGGGLALPALRPPFDLLAGIVAARGWNWRDKLGLLRTALGWRLAGFACDARATVASLCQGLTPRVVQELIEPLCLSALNTPMQEASGTVFLRVMKDALFAVRGGADLLLPRLDLGALLPDAALRQLGAAGHAIRLGHRVQRIEAGAEGDGARVDDEAFDRIVLACPSWEAARLARTLNSAESQRWADTADGLSHEAITTVYARSASPLAAPMLALRSGHAAPAQFVFDRSALTGPPGLLAFVISASQGDRERLQAQVMAQGRAQLGLADLQPLQTVVEKRATFACRVGAVRPGMRVAPGVLACGDHVEGPYPATLEGAVRAGLAAARAL